MPAAAVIPAPIAYIKVVAVKKLVVEPVVVFPCCLAFACWILSGGYCGGAGFNAQFFFLGLPVLSFAGPGWCLLARTFTVTKLECSKQAATAPEYLSME